MTEGKGSKVNNSQTQKDTETMTKQFDQFEDNLKEMTLDRMNAAPKEETELKAKISDKEMRNSNEIYLKPKRTIQCRVKFDEKYRKEYEYKKELVNFVAENRELIGETITLWTKKFPGQPAEEWEVPCNKPLWGPRYLAERIKECYYHRFIMEEKTIEHGQLGTMYGSMAVDTTVQRLDAHPASQRKSVFMGNSNF